MEASPRDSVIADMASCSSIEKQDSFLKPPDTRSWTCECFPDVPPVMSTGIPPKPVPPFPDPCVCYGLPEPYLKPGPKAGYLGMGYPPPGFRSPAFLRTPGYVAPKTKKEYAVVPYGRGIIPPYGPDDLEVHADVAQVYAIHGSDGFTVEVTEFGARVMAIRAPDVDGQIGEVLLGFDSPEEYWEHKTLHWGGVVGRLADRVTGPEPHLRVPGIGDFLLDENDEEDHYMGGPTGLDRVLWKSNLLPNGVLFTYLSRAGENRYPGNVLLSVSYKVLPVNKLVIQVEATSTQPTPLALIIPLAFNLAGHDSGEKGMKNHVVTLHADKYYVINEAKRATGAKRTVAASPYDMRIPRDFKKMIENVPNKSYNVLFCARNLREGEKQCLMAKLYHPTTRRVLEVWSDLPVLHFATDLGILERPVPPPSPAAVKATQSVLDSLLHRISDGDSDDSLSRQEYGGGDQPSPEKALNALYKRRSAPNPGYESKLPQHEDFSPTDVVTGVLDDLLQNIRTPPEQFVGFAGVKYYNECGIMLTPQLPPLFPDKSNLERLVLRPGQRYSHAVTYVFSVLERRTRGKRRRWGRQRTFKREEEGMIDHCSAHSSLNIKEDSFLEIHDVCSSKEFRPSQSSI